jgi:homoserine trans-succinylase
MKDIRVRDFESAAWYRNAPHSRYARAVPCRAKKKEHIQFRTNEIGTMIGVNRDDSSVFIVRHGESRLCFSFFFFSVLVLFNLILI